MTAWSQLIQAIKPTLRLQTALILGVKLAPLHCPHRRNRTNVATCGYQLTMCTTAGRLLGDPLAHPWLAPALRRAIPGREAII